MCTNVEPATAGNREIEETGKCSETDTVAEIPENARAHGWRCDERQQEDGKRMSQKKTLTKPRL